MAKKTVYEYRCDKCDYEINAFSESQLEYWIYQHNFKHRPKPDESEWKVEGDMLKEE